MPRLLFAAALCAALSACATTPAVDDPPAPGPLDELTDSVSRSVADTVATERQRVEEFPDLPDAADAGTASREPAGSARQAATDGAPGVATERAQAERRDAFNPYVLTAHRQNFILPAYASSDLNRAVYRQNEAGYADLQPVELRFQLSLKAQLNGRDLLFKDDSLWFGLTLAAWWQVYNAEDSRPFRESNYTPEFFYIKPLLWGPFGGSTSVLLGIGHQSNGQQVELSRSWNRLYAGLVYERGDFSMTVRPWYRLPEDEKEGPDDPRGDDNPDILDFMGHGDVRLYYRHGKREYGAVLRGNPSTSKGAARLSATFPLTQRYRGLIEYFVGYGDSLIDYDHFQHRIGIGIALTDLS